MILEAKGGIEGEAPLRLVGRHGKIKEKSKSGGVFTDEG